MNCEGETLEALKLKLKSVTKLKLSKERDVVKLRSEERSLFDELNMTQAEIDNLSEQLEALKNEITQHEHQMSMIEICSSSEDVKIVAHIDTLTKHLDGFQDMFRRDQEESQFRHLEHRNKVAEQQELARVRDKQIAVENEQLDREAAAVEAECEAIERECVVLKKRNNAVMLKLRRKLLEAENTRRELMTQNQNTNGSQTGSCNQTK